ncbi:MAG: DUF2332 family protein [Actinophytocola sp.]|nr:DUF2332 family protein [Actinophytocola sp.]
MSSPVNDIEAARRGLAEFAGRAEASSPLYAHLAGKAAEDDEVAGLLVDAPEPDGELLLAVAHRLLQADPIHPLTRYYPTLGGFDGVDAETWPMFRTFLLERADRARALLASRVVRNNDVQRAALLYPALSAVAKQAKGTIGLIEVGACAGLLLGLDKFGYRYHCDDGVQHTAGPTKAAVGLHCAVAGPGFGGPRKKLSLGERVGLDPAPVDLADEDELAWLDACIWADQPERVRLLRTAAAAQGKNPPDVVAGDGAADLASVAERLPSDAPLVVMNSNTMPHMGEQGRATYVAALAALAEQRPLWWVSHEPYEQGIAEVLPGRDDLGPGAGVLSVAHWSGPEPDVTVLATTDLHGGRMTWLG